jgi:predicted TIM-barrel fold metal-dependent hydrolase
MGTMDTALVGEAERDFDARVARLEPYDLCAWIGRYPGGWVAYEDADDLLAALRRSQIRGALVTHKACELHDARQGNDMLGAMLPSLPGCHAAIAVLPPGSGEFDDLPGYLDRAMERGFRAVRVFPKLHRYTLRLPTVPAMLKALEERGLPLIIQIGQTGWDEIGSLARTCPKLAVVVDGVGHHEFLNIRTCLPWLTSTPNLLVTTHALFLCGELELLVDRMGAERVLFASNQPMDDPAAGLSLLTCGAIADEAKRRIAGGNARRLLDRVGKGGYFA